MLAEFRVARCRAAVASPEELARIASERAAARAAAKAAGLESEPTDEADHDLALPEELEIYELEPEIAPEDSGRAVQHVFASNEQLGEPECAQGGNAVLSRAAVTPSRVAITIAVIAVTLGAAWLLLKL